MYYLYFYNIEIICCNMDIKYNVIWINLGVAPAKSLFLLLIIWFVKLRKSVYHLSFFLYIFDEHLYCQLQIINYSKTNKYIMKNILAR